MRIMLTLIDREEISRGLAEDLLFVEIAVQIGRDSSVVSRDVARHGGRAGYRAVVAEQAASVARELPEAVRGRALGAAAGGGVPPDCGAAGHPGRSRAGCPPTTPRTRLAGCPMRRSCATRRQVIEWRWETFAAGPSQRPGRSWGQPDPGNAGEGGKRPRQRRDGSVLPDGPGPASKTRRCNESEPVVEVP